MKQVTRTTGKATIVVVDLPEGAFNIKCVPFRPYGIYYILKSPKAPRGKIGCFVKTDFDVKKLGLPSKLTEEQWQSIVEGRGKSIATGKPLYADYYGEFEEDSFHTATESGLSLLKANGVVMENPISNDDRHRFAEWLEWQNKLWLNPQIFVKV